MVRFDFSGRSVLVTGASAGIGNAIACAFRDAGAAVHATGTRPRESYDTDLDRMTFHQADIGDAAALERLAASLPTLDILVNNAGMVLYRGQEYERDNFQRVLDVNLTGMMTLSGLMRPKLAASGAGSVLNLTSVTAFFGSRGNPAYGASKAGILQLTKTLAVAWARDGIRVNAIAPGFVATEMTKVSQSGAVNEGILQRTPLGRWGTPADIAGAALFLASDAAAFITGETLTVDGGLSCNL
ncbi:MAG: SDR family oxidoreductase [Alphaproteobacteria bacterium]|nr:SDR family oxidoreductase [Alphaproteobacteria bacterium]MCB9928075.1 SDR family oxidoreductase [Alphaproteobacteria bacterium]